ncbi:hypothetical protein MMC25_002290 [Agyrium rufum]|nr:hypothetical protein [Agyrium rufum]
MAFPDYPPTFERRSKLEELMPGIWPTFMDYCIMTTHASLSLPAAAFSKHVHDQRHMLDFLSSYQTSVLSENPMVYDMKRATRLRRQCFILVHRLITELDPVPEVLLDWDFLFAFARVFKMHRELRPLFRKVWSKAHLQDRKSILQSKQRLLKILDGVQVNGTSISQEDEEFLTQVMRLLAASSEYASFLLIGSDIVDALEQAYLQASPELQKKITSITHATILGSLRIDDAEKHRSVLFDHLYGLKSSSSKASASGGPNSLWKSLAISTRLYAVLGKYTTGKVSSRAKPLIIDLKSNSGGSLTIRRKRRKAGITKGKGKANPSDRDAAGNGLHIHKMSLVSQIQDLFPDLGSAFVFKLLDEYNDSAEEVTAHLLEGTLPPYLRDADRTEGVDYRHLEDEEHAYVPDLAPSSTPPHIPERRNVFDNDEFDNLAMDMSRVHVGRKDANLTADDLLADRSTAPNKAAILSALAAFDSDDDERDDTYDVEDVGGTVDAAVPGTDEIVSDAQDKNEEALFGAYKRDPHVFERDSNTRRGKARQSLKTDTGLTDEAIEGWAIMIGRDPRRLRKMEAKYAGFTGAQRELASTAYRESPQDSGTDPEDGPTSQNRRGFGGRGRGGFRGGRGGGDGSGRGGSAAGPSSDPTTQRARQKKDTNKASRANHNRQAGRARKVARAGFLG